MTSHAPTIDFGNHPPLPNQHFSSWLRGQTALFISQISAILGFVLFIASLIYYVAHLTEHSEVLKPLTVKLIVDYAHVVFMAVFILVIIQVLDDNGRGSHRVKVVHERVFGTHHGDFQADLKRSQNQLKIFKRRFLWFWIGMLFLYVFFACQHSYALATSEPEKKSTHQIPPPLVADNVRNSRQDSFTLASFNAISTTSTPIPESNSSEVNQSKSIPPELAEVSKQLVLPFVVFFFNNLTLLFIYWCFLVMDIPSDEMGERYYKYRNRSAAVVVGLTLLFPALVPFKLGLYTVAEWNAYSAIFDALSGVINAMVLALLIARLDSKLIGLPSWLISILYSYAAVQPLFMVFELSDSKVLEKIATSVLIFVFVSKIYFFLIITYALQTGKMLNYLFCFPILRQLARDNQPAIEALIGESDDTEKHFAAEESEANEGRLIKFLSGWDKQSCKRLGKRRIAQVRRYLSRWFRGDYPLVISKWLGLAAVCYFFLSLMYSVLALHTVRFESNEFRKLDFVIDVCQLAAILGIIATLYLLRTDNRYGRQAALRMGGRIFQQTLNHRCPSKEGKKQLRKFKEYFLYFWCVTFLLYITFLLDHAHIVFFSGPLYSLHLMLQELLYPFLEYLLGTLNLLFIFWCFVVLQSPAFDKRTAVRQRLLINNSGFVVALMIAGFPLLLFMVGGPFLTDNHMQEYATVFEGITGTLSAIGLALLIARLDSKLVRLQPWCIGILFAYASIQPLFVAFALNMNVLKMVQTSVLTAAFGLKICFFLILVHTVQSGKVLNYLVCFPFLEERVDSVFENQFEIRLSKAEAHSFTVSIFRKNELCYSIEKRLTSRKRCDRFVRYLRRRMENRNAYSPSLDNLHVNSQSHHQLGTYWVELRSSKGRLLCESIPFRSEDEAHDLITESINKVPYCKYSRT